jgi:hypothetical protein
VKHGRHLLEWRIGAERIPSMHVLQLEAKKEPQPELQILKPMASSKYEKIVAGVLSIAAKTGLTKIGFVTDPSGVQ